MDMPLRARPPKQAKTDSVSFGDTGFNSLSRDLTEYDLYAVVNHIGGINSGHYTACVKHKKHWLCCNDRNVYRMPEEDVISANAYLLFYARSDMTDPAAKLNEIFSD